MISQEFCEITSYELTGGQLWGLAITAGATVGLVLITGWWVIEKLQDWWYGRYEESTTADVTAVDPETVEPYIPSVDTHMQVAKELINDVEGTGSEIPGYDYDKERDSSEER